MPIVALLAGALFTNLALAQSDAPRNDLPDGTIYVIHRCFANSCAGRAEPPILKYNASGKLLKTWGVGMFIFPHGADGVGVDAQGNVYGAVVRRRMLERHAKK
jgi:hypothetical protein